MECNYFRITEGVLLSSIVFYHQFVVRTFSPSNGNKRPGTSSMKAGPLRYPQARQAGRFITGEKMIAAPAVPMTITQPKVMVGGVGRAPIAAVPMAASPI
jgi:hypothetical protein